MASVVLVEAARVEEVDVGRGNVRRTDDERRRVGFGERNTGNR
jgi:hypothetical protein